MGRKNSNALRGGNAPHNTIAATARVAWLRLVEAVIGTPQETAAQLAAARTDSELGPKRTDAWYARAGMLFRELTVTH